MQNLQNNLLTHLVENLDLPKSAYDKATQRYEDLGAWFERPESSCAIFKPHVFSQGSFRLGTAIRPLDKTEEYDLDLVCKLRSGLSSDNVSQQYLKDLVGDELKAYRIARNISDGVESKRRCWRHNYADELSFHMDIVPCIPKSEYSRRQIYESLVQKNVLQEKLARTISDTSVEITDTENIPFNAINNLWRISNPEGYAAWFEERMQTNEMIVESLKLGKVDTIPNYQKKTPLQKVVQLLKRHRDVMFNDATTSESKPISVIITTIAAKSYNRSTEFASALNDVITGLKEFRDSNSIEVWNPTNPLENFADKWIEPKYANLRLKENFHNWVTNVIADFNLLLNPNNAILLSESIEQNFQLSMTDSEIKKILNIDEVTSPYLSKKMQEIETPKVKPWSPIG